MNETPLYTVSWKNIINGIFVAVLTGIALPISALVQSGQFDLFTLDWHGVLVIAVNGAIAGFVGYLAKHFFSNSQGQFAGVGPTGK